MLMKYMLNVHLVRSFIFMYDDDDGMIEKEHGSRGGLISQ